MPQNKRESFIYTVIMCFTMVLWMSIYNVTLHTGTFNAQVIKDAVSCSMVVPMVIIMSLYGAIEASIRMGDFSNVLFIWLTNIPKNFVMALPFQLIIAGPLVRKVFRTIFPEGKVLA